MMHVCASVCVCERKRKSKDSGGGGALPTNWSWESNLPVELKRTYFLKMLRICLLSYFLNIKALFSLPLTFL